MELALAIIGLLATVIPFGIWFYKKHFGEKAEEKRRQKEQAEKANQQDVQAQKDSVSESKNRKTNQELEDEWRNS